MRSALGALPDSGGVTFHDHFTRLADVPAGARVVFTVRDPVARFVSGFNSRLRKGLPRNFAEWTPVLEDGFTRFPTPNSVAEALSDPDHLRRRQAQLLITNIFHVATPLSFWLGSVADLRARAADLLLVMWQARFDEDFETLKRSLGLPPQTQLPRDLAGAHATPPELETALSALAVANLSAWYAGDYALYEAALELRERILARSG